jgi:hypothetical protein
MLKPLALYAALEHMSNWVVRLDGDGPITSRDWYSFGP